MHLAKVSLSQTKSFSDFFIDYIQQKEELKPFYNRFPTPDNFSGQLKEKEKSFSKEHRDVLVKELAEQYRNITTSEIVTENIKLLQDTKTFTIVTGHQLNICTGPLYFIYKIVTVINACKKLKEQYPNYNFVPVYWMASEDHDYDEIKSFRLLGKKYTWNTKQQGAVGRFSTTGLLDLLDTIPGDGKIFKEAYSKHNLIDAVRYYVNELFKDEGLVVVDADSKNLKSLFKEIIHDDTFNHTTKKLVDKTNTKLESLGYKTQVYCRDINFFYLDDNVRSRIEKKNNHFEVIDTDIAFDSASLAQAIDQTPEKFSPNVILRPLYQEVILPNLAYVGGPAEVVYWLQLKDVFDHYKIPFPILMPRNFAMVMENHIAKKFEKTGLELPDLFLEKNLLFNGWVKKNSNHTLTVGDELTNVQNLFEQLRDKAEKIDKTLGPFVGAESKRMQHSLERIERKMLRAEKRRQGDRLRQIEAIKDALFPNGSLQERTDNFLNFYLSDHNFIGQLIELLDPFDFQFNVIRYDS